MNINEMELLRLLEAHSESVKFRRNETWKPIPQQKKFLDDTNHVKGLIAGNRVGKSDTMSYEVACHATGIYPDWWEGRRFNRPVVVWVIGMSYESLIGTIQKKFFGDEYGGSDWGSGFIPKSCLPKKPVMKTGLPGVISRIDVMHKSGGTSKMKFWSRTQDRQDFQGDEVDIIAFDEEPPPEVHSECVTRQAVPMSKGESLTVYAFTPLSGSTDVVKGLLDNPRAKLYSLTMDDCPWLTQDAIETILSTCKTDGEKKARRYGIPCAEIGQIFRFDPSEYSCESFEIPSHWPRIGGLDIGRNHPTGAVALAWDRNADCVYVYQEFKKTASDANDIAKVLKHWNVRFAASHDAFNTTMAGNVANILQNEGLEVFSAGRDPWARIETAKQLIGSGRLWVFKDRCPELMKEIREYRTKEDGATIYKVDDDVVDAFTHAVHFYKKASCDRPGVFHASQPTWQVSSDGYY